MSDLEKPRSSRRVRRAPARPRTWQGDGPLARWDAPARVGRWPSPRGAAPASSRSPSLAPPRRVGHDADPERKQVLTGISDTITATSEGIDRLEPREDWRPY